MASSHARRRDGYTLLLAGSSLVMNSAMQRVNYDAVTSFAPISQVLELEIFLVVRPDLPAKTLRELIAYARRQPGRLSYASVGNGSVTHFQMELLKAMTGVHMVHVPYRGSAPALTDFVGGQIDLMLTALRPSGRTSAAVVRALAVAAPTRSRALPEVPTVPEAGVPGYEATAWSGVLAPPKTPERIVERLNRDIVAATRDVVFQQRVEAVGGRIASSSPADYFNRIRSETAKWAALAKERGLRTH